MKSRILSCGVKQVYDGAFSGILEIVDLLFQRSAIVEGGADSIAQGREKIYPQIEKLKNTFLEFTILTFCK